MSFGDAISLYSLILNFITSIILGLLAYLTLKFTAKPKLKLTLSGFEKIKKYYTTEINKDNTITIEIKNVGRFYAKPASTNTRLWINFDQNFDLRSAKFGATNEKTDDIVKRGKNNSKYFMADGIHLFYLESGETVIVNFISPNKPGIYDCWISYNSSEADYGIFQFKIKVNEIKN
jgi:hypothetical protein